MRVFSKLMVRVGGIIHSSRVELDGRFDQFSLPEFKMLLKPSCLCSKEISKPSIQIRVQELFLLFRCP